MKRNWHRLTDRLKQKYGPIVKIPTKPCDTLLHATFRNDDGSAVVVSASFSCQLPQAALEELEYMVRIRRTGGYSVVTGITYGEGTVPYGFVNLASAGRHPVRHRGKSNHWTQKKYGASEPKQSRWSAQDPPEQKKPARPTEFVGKDTLSWFVAVVAGVAAVKVVADTPAVAQRRVESEYGVKVNFVVPIRDTAKFSGLRTVYCGNKLPNR